MGFLDILFGSSSSTVNQTVKKTDIPCPNCGENHKLYLSKIPFPGRFFCSNCGYTKDIGDDNGHRPSPMAMRY